MEKILSMSTSPQSFLQQFPNIYRFITERQLSPRTVFFTKVAVTSFFSGLLLIGIILQSVTLYQNAQEVKRLKSERVGVATELEYWKKIAAEYKGYRDVYYRIAVLEYKLGNTSESKDYIRKALELDPNFQAGRVLGAKIGF